MIVEGQKVKVKWHSNNRKHFEKYGYIFTFVRDEFEVNIDELNKGSKIEIKCSCDVCNTIFFRIAKLAFKYKKHFCSVGCKTLNMKKHPNNPSTKVLHPCENCGEQTLFSKHRHDKLLYGETKNLFCSRKCQSVWKSEHSKGENNPNYNSVYKSCNSCNKDYTVPFHRKDTANYCSEKCKREGSRKRVEVKCGTCEKSFLTTPSQIKKSKSGLLFCSNSCVGLYNGIIRDKKIEKTCLICQGTYKVKRSEFEKSVTCSSSCQNVWQSQYLIGVKANNYNHNIPLEKRIVECKMCKKECKISPYKIKELENGKEKFCSKICFQKWYAEDWSQREEWKEESRIRAVKMLEDGVFNHTDTGCQVIVNEILNLLNIKFVNEYGVKYYSIDNYIPDHNLAIEVMGTFWHADPRKYKEINYQRQLDRIKSDKAKNSFLNNNQNINILYLWEQDILSNPLLIEKLIIEYINLSGNLTNFHSFNYYLNKSDELKLNGNNIIPYQDYNIEDMRNVINILTEKRDKTQYDKWISFNCEHCGKEKVQLISKYNNSKTHCCSYECSYQLRKSNN
ncbi:hypothetical protein P4V41_07105 [Fictibacillus nanhaiensis]|uniref:hypothetical protein n=1 Tax=Fictibacillus nanhaiensis TaxID=742169 RepID=UPI002E1A3002|nr:hypothetical protein [Fictibacillus nanhaiensis]